MSTETTPATNHATPPRPGVNPGFGKFLAGLILGLVVGLAAGAVLPTMLGLGGAAIGGGEMPAGAATPRTQPRGAVMPPPEQPIDQEPRRTGDAAPEGAKPPAGSATDPSRERPTPPAEEPKPATPPPPGR